MIKSKKLISIVSVLAMVLSMFSAFTVAQASGAAISAEVLEGSTFVQDGTVKIKYSYAGLEEANQNVNMMQFYMPIDTENFAYVSHEAAASFSGATIGFNDATNSFNFTYSSMTTVNAVEGDLVTVELKVLQDLPTNYNMPALENVKIVSMDANFNTYEYAEVGTPTIVLNEYENPTKITAKVVEDSAEADGTIKITYSYEGLEEANQNVNMLQFYMPIDITKFAYVSHEAAASFSGATIGFNDATNSFNFTYSSMTTVNAVAGDLVTVELKLLENLAEPFTMPALENVKIVSMDANFNTYEYAEVGTPTVVVGGGDPVDPTPTPEPSEPTPTPMPEEDWTLVTTVDTTDDLAVGAKYEISTEVADGKTFDGTFDIVVAVYNAEGVAVGFVVYNDVAIGEVNTFYTSQDNTISVNTISDIDEDSSALFNKADMLAAKK